MPTPRPSEAPTLAQLLDAKGPLTVQYAVLCTAYWLTLHTGCRDVTASEVRAAYRRPRASRLPAVASPSQALLRCASVGLLERVVTLVEPADPAATAYVERRAYRLTPMGRAVVEALPDLERVGALRGMGHAAPGRGRSPVARADPGVRPPTRGRPGR